MNDTQQRKRLTNETVTILMTAYSQGKMPTRKFIVKTIETTSPEFKSPRLDLEIAYILNSAVDHKILQRVGEKGIRYYIPTDKYLTERS